MPTELKRVQVYVDQHEREQMLKQIALFNQHRMLTLTESQFYLMCARKELRKYQLETINKQFLDRQIKANPSTQ